MYVFGSWACLTLRPISIMMLLSSLLVCIMVSNNEIAVLSVSKDLDCSGPQYMKDSEIVVAIWNLENNLDFGISKSNFRILDYYWFRIWNASPGIRDQRCGGHLAGISFAEQSFFGAGSQSEQGLRTLIDTLQQVDLRGNETNVPMRPTQPAHGMPMMPMQPVP